MVADSLCLLIMQINERPTPQLVALMDKTRVNGLQEQYLSSKLGLLLEDHFDKVEEENINDKKLFKITHQEQVALVDSQNFTVVKSDSVRLS
jgi:hypothetical protein